MPSPSLIHEGVIALVRDKPAFAAGLLRDLFHVEVPSFDEARLTEAALNELVPVEYQADAVVLFDVIYDKKKPVFGTIFEVQLERRDRKRYTWPLYVVAARARYECPFVLLAVTPDPAVARWASQPVDLGDGMIFRPRVIGPQGIPLVTDPDLALSEPQLAVLSVVAHGGGDVAAAVSVARAAVHAVLPLPDEQRMLYSALIESALSEAARKALAMEPQIKKFFSEEQRRSYDRAKTEGRAEGEAKGKAEGKAEGKADSVMRILKLRGVAFTNEQQQRIVVCTDVALLDHWLGRALSVTTADELFT